MFIKVLPIYSPNIYLPIYLLITYLLPIYIPTYNLHK
jgi:hypothetical protein